MAPPEELELLAESAAVNERSRRRRRSPYPGSSSRRVRLVAEVRAAAATCVWRSSRGRRASFEASSSPTSGALSPKFRRQPASSGVALKACDDARQLLHCTFRTCAGSPQGFAGRRHA